MLSLRTKLTIWYLAIVSVVLITFGAAIYFYLSHSLLSIIDTSLLDQAEVIAHNYQSSQQPAQQPGQQPNQPGPSAADVDPDLRGGHAGGARIVPQFVQFIDDTGEVVDEIKDAAGHSLPVARDQLSAAGPRLDTVMINQNEAVRVATWPLQRPGTNELDLYIRVGQSLLDLQRAQARLLRLLAISIPGTLLLASLGGLLLADKALSPVERVAQAARRIGVGNLRERVVVPKANDEISRLASLFNEMIERLEKAFERERRFTADASHEMRTPLAVLRGEMELALRKPRTPEQYQEVIGGSLEEIVRLSRLVEDLLTLARSESGELALERNPVELSKLAGEICQYVEPLAEAKGLKLEFTATPAVTITGDARRLRQLFINLLDNAIKYTPPGGLVKLVLTKAESGIGIEITDTGRGIPHEEQPFIFERFYRQKHTTNEAEDHDASGFGLGLAICKWITEAHGGQLLVNSKPGQGSQFSVFFPNRAL